MPKFYKETTNENRYPDCFKKILTRKREEVLQRQDKVSIDELHRQADQMPATRGFPAHWLDRSVWVNLV